MRKEPKLYPGTKLYQRDQSLEKALDSVIRIKKYDEEKKEYTAYDVDGNLIHVSEEETRTKWTRLNPDALFMLSIVEFDGLTDVLVCVHKRDGSDFKPVPDIVARQNILDIYSGNANTVGMCVSEKTKASGIEFGTFLQYDEMLAMYVSVAYIDDTIDDILRFTNTKRADKILQRLHTNHYSGGINNLIKGSATSLKELLMSNQFMMEYHYAFDVVEVPFSLKKPELVPDTALADIIAEITRKVPSAIYVVRYDKSVDLSKFEREYILATANSAKAHDDDRDIYVVGYDVNEKISYTDYKYGSRENMLQKLNELGFS